MTRILDCSQDTSVADMVADLIDTEGFSPAEAIPGLIAAVILLAEQFPDPRAAIDEATDLLCEGGAE